MKSITPQTDRLMKFAGYARDLHVLPVAGGALDQSPAFLAGMTLIERDRNEWRSYFGPK